MPERVQVDIAPSEHVTALVYPAAQSRRAGISLILAHGAGANQASRFMVDFASALSARGIGTVTFNFLYTEQGRRLPDPNEKLEACWRKMIEAFYDGRLHERLGREKLAIGGKSMGGRIASQVAAKTPEGIAGLVLVGYPLHPPSRPQQLRTRHLPSIRAPMLFVQGTRDTFGTPQELRPIIGALKAPADLCVVEGGDHSFKVLKKAGRPQKDVDEFVLDAVERWLREKLAP